VKATSAGRRPSAARAFLYAPNQADNNVAVLDTSTNTIVSPSR